MSATWSGHLGTAKGVPPMYALIGGFMVVFGARIAGGCTRQVIVLSKNAIGQKKPP